MKIRKAVLTLPSGKRTLGRRMRTRAPKEQFKESLTVPSNVAEHTRLAEVAKNPKTKTRNARDNCPFTFATCTMSEDLFHPKFSREEAFECAMPLYDFSCFLNIIINSNLCLITFKPVLGVATTKIYAL